MLYTERLLIRGLFLLLSNLHFVHTYLDITTMADMAVPPKETVTRVFATYFVDCKSESHLLNYPEQLTSNCVIYPNNSFC